jgi:hypothetical protein
MTGTPEQTNRRGGDADEAIFEMKDAYDENNGPKFCLRLASSFTPGLSLVWLLKRNQRTRFSGFLRATEMKLTNHRKTVETVAHFGRQVTGLKPG